MGDHKPSVLQRVLMEVVCCSVCPFTNQDTAPEHRRAVALGNPSLPSSETAPSPCTVLTGSVCESSKAGVRKHSSDE